MVIARISSGLGNQLFQYATARALSIRLGSRLYLDRTLFGPHEPYVCELPRYNIRAALAGRVTTALARHGTESPPPRFKARAAAAVARRCFTCIVDRQAGYDARLGEVRGNVILRGHWETEKYFVDHRDVIRRELTLRHAPDQVNAGLVAEMAGREAVCVHIRRGDRERVPELRAFHGLCPLSYYEAGLTRIREHCQNPWFYVFSNDPDWVRANLRLPGPSTYVTHNLRKQDYEDLRLMTACKHFVIANSTFSWWGAWLSNHPDKLVIGPKNWFAVEHASVPDLLPPTWVRM